MSIQVLIGIILVYWLITLAASVLAFRWSFTSIQRRFWLCVGLSVASIIGSCWALTRLHLAWSQTVNGERQWLVDSNWFFTLTLVLGALALVSTLWQRRKLNFGGPGQGMTRTTG